MFINTSKMKQVGMIVYGNGIDSRAWINLMRNQGYYVLLCDGRAELYR